MHAVPLAAAPELAWPQRAASAGTRVSLRAWVVRLIAVDLVAGGVATSAGVLARVDTLPYQVGGLPLPWLVAVLTVAWPLVLLAAGTYDTRVLATGSEEFRRVGNAGIWMLGALIFAAFLAKDAPPRGSVLVGIPLLIALTAVGRYGVRRLLQRRIVRGEPIYRTFVVGTLHDTRDVVRHIERVPWCGFAVVGSAIHEGGAAEPRDVAAAVDVLLDEVAEAGADTIAVAGSGALAPGMLRALSWRLEGTGIRLVLAPSVTDIAGPRIVVRPVQGLPLLHVEDPELRAGQRLLKGALDRTAAAVALLILSPGLLAVAATVRLTSPGPALFRQERIGHHGRRFRMLKFRTMVDGADSRVAELAHLNEHDGPLFKIRNDPRRTRVGRWLRRMSIDELPQLWNVLRGDMSLVGPRPPLPSEVDHYGDDARRRLLVRPGLTGLWQVAGRAALPWDEAVRLDLYYVENWSVALDLMVLWKTLWAVIRGQGAY